MKKYLLFIILFCISHSAFAQWIKLSDYNVGVSGRMFAGINSVYLYGSHGGFDLYRSDDQGNSWNNINSQFPYDVYYMHKHNGELFAVTTNLGSSAYRFYNSTDDGLSWAEKSNIPEVTGNGAILHMSSDGSTLYACSNRRSYYKSTDNGTTWTETIINVAAGGNLIMLVASGNDLISIVLGSGAVVSTDGGQNWEIKNPAAAISILFRSDNNIFGLSFGGGLFRWNTTTKNWDAVNNGIPDGGTFQIPLSMAEYGNTLFVITRGLLGGVSILSSTDQGDSWNALSMEGLPALNAAGSSTMMCVNSTRLYVFNYTFSGGTSNNEFTGVFASEVSLTGINESGLSVSEFELSQNFPNPFNPATNIKYSLLKSDRVNLTVFDILGRVVKVLVDENQVPGEHIVRFDGSNLASGFYLYQLRAGGNSLIKKMLLTK